MTYGPRRLATSTTRWGYALYYTPSLSYPPSPSSPPSLLPLIHMTHVHLVCSDIHSYSPILQFSYTCILPYQVVNSYLECYHHVSDRKEKAKLAEVSAPHFYRHSISCHPTPSLPGVMFVDQNWSNLPRHFSTSHGLLCNAFSTNIGCISPKSRTIRLLRWYVLDQFWSILSSPDLVSFTMARSGLFHYDQIWSLSVWANIQSVSLEFDVVMPLKFDKMYKFIHISFLHQTYFYNPMFLTDKNKHKRYTNDM